MLKIVQELKFLLEENPPLFSSKDDFLYFALQEKEAIEKKDPISPSLPIEKEQRKEEVPTFRQETKDLGHLDKKPTIEPQRVYPSEWKHGNDTEESAKILDRISGIEKDKPKQLGDGSDLKFEEKKAFLKTDSLSSLETKAQEKSASIQTLGFSSIRKLMQKIDPNFPILDQIPNDQIAKKIANRWKTKNQAAPFSILSAFETKEQRRFLESIAVALDIYFSPSKLIDAEKIEKENQWESFLSTQGLEMILISDAALWQLPHLKAFYKENPSQGTRFLQKVPLFLLPDISLYFKDPRLKRSLWNSLCQKCLLK